MTLEAYCTANPTDPRVIRIKKLSGRPLKGSSYNSWVELGRLVGALLREINEKDL